ncbi:MAG TPA: DNA polymerase Y family protein [Acidimicrobiia bacterium]|nr:DNA polymerase Y family protein [Acidimicrobiia bacterium]
MRTLCVWFPDWPLTDVEVEPDRPCFVFEDRPSRVSGGEAQRIRAANPAARQAGIEHGMGRRAAEALCPTALDLARDLAAETRRFEQVVLVLEGLIPRVEVVEPGLAFVSVEGAILYYGGEGPLVERVDKELSNVIDQPRSGLRIGLAEGPFAARWAATSADQGPRVIEDTAAFLSTLDISTLEKDELIATFRWLGVSTLGELAGLPREAVASRFGYLGLHAHRLASGEDQAPQPRSIPPHLAVEAFYDDPLETLDQVAFSARALSVRLMLGLRKEGLAPHRVEITAAAANGKERSRTWRSADPFIAATLTERVWWQLRAWVEQGGVPGGLTRLRLDPSDLSGDGRQLALLEPVAGLDGTLGWQGYDPGRPEVERALARAQALVGPEGVLQATPQGGRMPAEQVLWYRFGEEPGVAERDVSAPWPGATPGPSPALVPPEPVPFDIEWDEGIPTRVRLGSRWEPVLNWAGPWRLTGRWWKGEPHADRYQLVTSAGAFLVVVRNGSSFLAGVYD